MKLLAVTLATLFLLTQSAEAKMHGAAKISEATPVFSISQASTKITKPNIAGPMGMDVNSFTGNLFHQRHDEWSKATGRLSIDVTFSYNSGASKNNWGMGNGWTSTFNIMYEVTPGYIIVREPDGRKDSIVVSGSTYTPVIPATFAFSEYEPGKFMLRTKTGHKFLFDDATHKKVTSIVDPNNNTIVFSNFVSNQPSLITDESGSIISLNWGAGRLLSIVDSAASPPRTISYQYDARGNLKTVTYPMGHVYQYRYDARSRMVAFTDELSNTVNIAYTSSGAVSSITTPGSSVTSPTSLTFDYNPGSHQTITTEIVAGAPQSTTYTFDALKRLTRIQGGAGLDEQFEYNSQHDITRFINSNGHATDNTWDVNGNLLSSTNALGQTMSWSYEPVYSNVVSATDRNGNVTSYAYDANGNLLTASAPLGVVHSFTWNTHGDLGSSTDPLLNVTTYTHDGDGYLTSIAHPIGSESFSYDNSGNLVSHTDANGNTTVMTYDLLNRRTSMANALGGNTIYVYGGLDNLLQVTDENGHSTSYTYDDLNRVVAMTRPEGVTLVGRDEYGNIRQSTDFNGNMRSYNYDARNRPISMTDPLGHSSSVTYDNNGNVLSSTDFNGNTTLYQYDVIGRRNGVTDANGNHIGYLLDAEDKPTSVTDANLHTTTYMYDALGRMTQINHPIGTESFTYDLNSNLRSHTDPNGYINEFVYDVMDRRISSLDPLLHTTTFSYDPAGNLLSCTDPNGLTRSFTYDDLHRTTSSTNPLMEVTTYAYDAVGNQTSLSTPYGNTISYTYDASDRLISMSDVIGTLQSCTYDANSNRISATDALGNTTQYLYDVLDRLTRITAPLGQTAQYVYDHNSNIVSTVDGEGGTTTLAYDALDRMVSETFPGGLTTTCTFDPVGNLLSILDARGNSTTLLHDAMDRPIKTTYANGSFRQCTYDPAGNMISLQDQNGSSTTYGYDGMNRLINRSFPDGTSDVFVYDNGGRLITANNTAANVSLTYDGAGRILSEVMNGKTTSNSYNIPARVVTSTLPGGSVITNALNARLQPVTVATGGAPLVTRTYDAASRLILQTLDNGISSSYGYDDNGQVTSALLIRAGSIIAGENYTLDGRGFFSTVETPHHLISSEKHQYDPTTRLTGYRQGELVGGNIPAPVTQTEFVFDPVGNRSMVTKDGVPSVYTSNSINAYTSISGSVPISPTYDANGNMTSDGSRVFTFDYMDRLTGAMDVATNAVYAFDALGRRIQKTVNGTVTKYFYDGDAVVEERDGADAVTRDFVVGNDAPEVMNIHAGGGPVGRYFPHVSIRNNTVALSDNGGHMVERYGFDPFGMPTVYDSAYVPLASSAYNVNPLYGGQSFDMENALYESGGRAYNPQIGRYMQHDPSSLMGDPPDLRNGYSYVGNNPTNHSSGTPRRLVNSKFVVRELADPGVHLLSYSKPPIRRLKPPPMASAVSSNDRQIQVMRGVAVDDITELFTVGGGTMADDDWHRNSPSASAMPGNPIKGISVKGGRNHPSASATNFTVPFTGGGTLADDDWHRNYPSASAMPGNPIKGISVKGGRPRPDASGIAGGMWGTVNDFNPADMVHPPGTPPGASRRISDVRIVHPPGTPPGTWREFTVTGQPTPVGEDNGKGFALRGIRDIRIVHPPGSPPGLSSWNRRISDVRIVHPPGTPPGTWKAIYNPREYTVQYNESDYDFISRFSGPMAPPMPNIPIPLGMAINEKGIPTTCEHCRKGKAH